MQCTACIRKKYFTGTYAQAIFSTLKDSADMSSVHLASVLKKAKIVSRNIIEPCMAFSTCIREDVITSK